MLIKHLIEFIKSRQLRCFLFLVIYCLVICSQAKSLNNPNWDFKNYNVKLQIFNQKKTKIAEFQVQIADDNYKMQHGLMDMDFLPAGYGMLFDFKQEIIANMWMKNTRIPLDMVFIDKNNQIIDVAINTKPYSLKIISSKKLVTKVLEINANLTQKLAIKKGNKISLSN
jgi:uncharacterized membrane protein (UPF0127 family)